MDDESLHAGQQRRGKVHCERDADEALVPVRPGFGARQFAVGEALTIADCYLFVTQLWASPKIGLDSAPNLSAYDNRLTARDSVAKALADEGLD